MSFQGCKCKQPGYGYWIGWCSLVYEDIGGQGQHTGECAQPGIGGTGEKLTQRKGHDNLAEMGGQCHLGVCSSLKGPVGR